MAAAEQLDTTGRAAPQHLALHGVLMCTAGYGAARDLAFDLLADATRTAARLGEHRALRDPLAANITSHKVSAPPAHTWPSGSPRTLRFPPASTAARH